MARIRHLAAGLALGLVAAAPAEAALSLTGAGAGFTLTTVIGGYVPTGPVDYQFVSIGVNNAGQLIGHTQNTAYVFADVDNQTIANGVAQSPTLPGNMAMARAGGVLYGSIAGAGYYRLNQNGTVAAQLTGPPPLPNSVFGLWANPVNGHLISSAALGLVDIDPITLTTTLVNAVSGNLLDGVTVTPDGKAAYVADVSGSRVVGFSLQTTNYGNQIFASAFLGTGPDGMGVLAGTCAQAGQIVVSNNNGTIGLINPSVNGSNQTVIATGGNRGDYAALDNTNGTLFLSQNDQIARLKAPTGCTIGTVIDTGTGGTGGVGSVPEPASLALLGAGLLGLGVVRRR